MSVHARVAAAVLLATAACAQNPSELRVEPLADGEWIVAGHTSMAPVLQQARDPQPARGRAAAPQLLRFAVLADTLMTAVSDTFTLLAGGEPIAESLNTAWYRPAGSLGSDRRSVSRR